MIAETHKIYKHLPHFDAQDDVIFITWRLAFTLPAQLLAELNAMKAEFERKLESIPTQYHYQHKARHQQQIFNHYDEGISHFQLQHCDLTAPENAQILTDILHSYHGVKYELVSYCIMSNHVHVLLKPKLKSPGQFHKISEIVQSIKSFSALRIHQQNLENGRFWAYDYYDRTMRNSKHLHDTIRYIMENPVKAGLVDAPEKWKWSYLNPDWCTFKQGD
jgi:REP element-mobilizing transposase RayT